VGLSVPNRKLREQDRRIRSGLGARLTRLPSRAGPLGLPKTTQFVDSGLAQFVEHDPKAKAGGKETLMPEMLDKANKGVRRGQGLGSVFKGCKRTMGVR
jgi:hypothetical protein